MGMSWNVVLFFGFLVPLILLLWPFAQWGPAAELILRVISAFSVQSLLCRVGKHKIIKAVPQFLTGLFAFWGFYLYFTSPHWAHTAFWSGLIADYVSPFISCVIAFGIFHVQKFKSK